MNLPGILINICEYAKDLLIYIVDEIKAGNYAPAVLLLFCTILLLDKDVFRCLLIMTLIILLAKVILK